MFITGHNLALLFAALENLSREFSLLFPAYSQTAGALLITAIWQGAVVAAGLTLTLRLTSRISAGLRFTLWIAGFLAVVSLPFLPAILKLMLNAPARATTAAVISAPRFSLDARWSVAICLLWAAVSLYRAIDLAAHSMRLRKLWLTASPVESASAPAKLPGRRATEVCTTDALDRPSVIGFFAPRILIPAWLLPRLTPGELDQILLHETEHLRRGDDWTNLLQKLSLILFPLNPVLLWMERQLCLEREMACDEAVIRVTRAPRAYAACLTTLAERGIEYRQHASESLSLGAWQRRPELVHRVHSLLRVKPLLGPWGARGLTAALACGLVFGSIELARCPQLVAFVPAHPEESAQLEQPATGRPAGNAREVLTAWKPAKPERSSRAYMTNLRATMPGNANPAGYSDAWESNSPGTAARKLAAAPAPHLTQTARQTLLKAEIPAPEQSWIVLTTWEEVAVSDKLQAPAADSDGSHALAPADQSGNQTSTPATTQDQAQQPSQIRVTRMVFRVIPAGFVSSSPTAVRTRDGWLVIQM